MEEIKIISSFTPPTDMVLSPYYKKHNIFYDNEICYKSVQQAFFGKLTEDNLVKSKISSLDGEDLRTFGNSLIQDCHTADWQIQTMLELNLKKFKENPVLNVFLKNTGKAHLENRLVYYDIFWGIYKQVGENQIGKILMQIR